MAPPVALRPYQGPLWSLQHLDALDVGELEDPRLGACKIAVVDVGRHTRFEARAREACADPAQVWLCGCAGVAVDETRRDRVQALCVTHPVLLPTRRDLQEARLDGRVQRVKMWVRPDRSDPGAME